MNSEKVKEIKKALKCCSEGKCEKCLIGKKDIRKCIDILLKDTLTCINELESENERLRKSDTSKEESSIEYYNLYRDFKRENQKLKDRIVELEKKIENGTLVELPCKVGDTVYSNERIMFEPLTVKVITIHQSIKFPVSYTVIAMAKNGRGIYLSRDNFNEDWFLTKAEAEARLKELQEQGGAK